MSAPRELDEVALGKAAAEPLIETFGIRGLYGYRNIALSSSNAATILIARNGSGKTTLLGALNAFLKLEFSRLKNLEFSEIYCRFRDSDEELILLKEDIIQVHNLEDASELRAAASTINVPPESLFKFITEDWEKLRDSDQRYENVIYGALTRFYGYTSSKLDKRLQDIYYSIYSRNPRLSHIIDTIKLGTRGYEILYLPTYRRVELALREDAKTPAHRRKKPKLAFDSGNLFSGDIQFGLGDILDRLSEMNDRITFQSNTEYRKISANIITDLIDGTFENPEYLTDKFPTKEDLDLLFSRVEQSKRHGPFYAATVPNLERIYNPSAIPESSRPFLNYFLYQLDKVIETARTVESTVQEFVDICNGYLASDDIGTYLGLDQFDQSDRKELRLNKTNLQVTVNSNSVGRISLDSLSSGEKQMISLFAKLYLYERPKIILIDEPELSLSIGWQRQILVDVIKSPLCRQLIAITHSPFVFDNELEPFAGSLEFSSERWDASPFDNDGFDTEDDSFEE